MHWGEKARPGIGAVRARICWSLDEDPVAQT